MLTLMSKPRGLLWRCIVGCLSASVILAGCGGQSNSVRPAGVTGSNIMPAAFHRTGSSSDEVRWWVNIHNDTGLPGDRDHPNGNYIWVTRYYTTNIFLPWYIEGADCLAPHETLLRDIPFSILDQEKKVKLRVEVKAYDATSCNAPTISDFYGPEDYLSFERYHEQAEPNDVDWILGYASIDVIPPHFHIFMQGDTASGKGQGPGPGVIKKYGGN